MARVLNLLPQKEKEAMEREYKKALHDKQTKFTERNNELVKAQDTLKSEKKTAIAMTLAAGHEIKRLKTLLQVFQQEKATSASVTEFSTSAGAGSSRSSGKEAVFLRKSAKFEVHVDETQGEPQKPACDKENLLNRIVLRPSSSKKTTKVIKVPPSSELKCDCNSSSCQLCSIPPLPDVLDPIPEGSPIPEEMHRMETDEPCEALDKHVAMSFPGTSGEEDIDDLTLSPLFRRVSDAHTPKASLMNLDEVLLSCDATAGEDAACAEGGAAAYSDSRKVVLFTCVCALSLVKMPKEAQQHIQILER